jgi:transposase
MRQLAMRFRGLLRSKHVAQLGVWLKDAHQSGLYAMQRFARTLRRDGAVRNAITGRWSNGQTKEQINRLKTLKRAMYGRAGTEHLRAHVAAVASRQSQRMRLNQLSGYSQLRSPKISR